MRKLTSTTLAVCMAALFANFAVADDQLPPPIQSPGTNAVKAPAKTAKGKSTTSSKAKKSATASKSKNAPSEPALPLTPGPAVVKQENVNIRAQAAINSEVVGKLHKNEQVNVLEEITLKKPKTDEPARWAKISLPTNSTVWINSHFIDANDKTVKAGKLNLRSGPGENYSVIGRVEKGAKIQEIEAKGDWLRIEPPSNGYAFVAAHLLRPEIASSTAVAQNDANKQPLQTAQVENPAAPAPASEPPRPADTGTTAATPAQAAGTPATASDAAPSPPEEEVKRVVTREGIVKRSVSIQAPTYFVLESLDTGRPINYLFSTNIALKNFWNHRIVVTGEEMLDER